MTLSTGARLGPYEVISPLGAGGMGEVYRARDVRLGREVAVKVLPEALAADSDRLRRFEQEARSASSLNHPNIVTVYDVGRDGEVSFIAMELVEGCSLREMLAGGPLAPKRMLSIGGQMADGLARAHASGIVHRDLKPENVMVTEDGLVKILDFGLAKLSPGEAFEAPGSQAVTAARGTEPGVILGTVGYMSPEQASGKPADFRSDQFSLGAILYEAASGRRAFQRATAVETLTAILREEPPPLASVVPSTPEPLRWVIERCLAKEPEERYASTRDLARDLASVRERSSPEAAPKPEAAAVTPAPAGGKDRWRLIAAAVIAAVVVAGAFTIRRFGRPLSSGAGERSVAILPFQNFGDKSENEYFSDGMTESLITDLAKVPGLLVIARNSVFQYKAKPVDVRRVGDELRVRYVLEGSVQRSGESVRVNAQLVDAKTGYHVWSERYDRPMKDIFALQDDISRNIVSSLKVALRPGGPAAGAPTANLEAYDAYLRGMHYAHSFDWVEKDRAIPFFEKAVSLDPGFARGHAALAGAFAKKAFEGDPEKLWRRRAEEAIEKGLALDPDLPEAYLARGNLAWTLENGFPHERVAADFHRAITASPNLAGAHAALASLYYHVGLLDESLVEYSKALKIDPYDLDSLYRIPRIHLYQARYAQALSEFDANPKFADDFLKPIVLDHLGRHEDALAMAERHSLTNPTHSAAEESADAASTLAVLRAARGDGAGAERWVRVAVEKGEGHSHFHHASYNIATAFALLGRKSKAVAWLEKTAAMGMPCYPLFEKDPYLENLRKDPAFLAFMTRMRTQRERFRATL
jgi:TolB-like protein/tetratricopeptide (TPR) repeat protein